LVLKPLPEKAAALKIRPERFFLKLRLFDKQGLSKSGILTATVGLVVFPKLKF
jgi:hypothetical protein